MGIKLIKEVHNRVSMESCVTDHDMALMLGPMGGVGASQLLPLHPRKGQLFKLSGKHNQGNTNHGHHKELRRPNVGYEVSVAHSGESDDDEVRGLEEVESSVAGPLEVLNSADAREDETNESGREDGELLGESGLASLHGSMKVIEHVFQGVLG